MEEGERKIAEKAKMAEALSFKVRSTDNPWQSLLIKYGNNRGKLFTEEEDRFLVCMTHELGYGKWEELKREVRLCPDFPVSTLSQAPQHHLPNMAGPPLPRLPVRLALQEPHADGAGPPRGPPDPVQRDRNSHSASASLT